MRSRSTLARCCSLAIAVTMMPLAVAAQAAQPAPWQPNETLVSAQADLIDPEFSQSRGMFVWSDEEGSLWLGWVDPATGDFIPPNGKGILVDDDTMRFQDAQKTKNGPEWVSTWLGDHIVHTKYDGRHTDRNSRLGYAYDLPDGSWVSGFLDSDGMPRKAPYGSLTPGDPQPRITYVDNRGNHFWRNLWDDASLEVEIADFPPSNYPIYHVDGARAVLYPLNVDGVDQVHFRDLDTGVVEQLTFDPGHKYQMFMWPAPEFGGDMVFFTLVDEREIRFYRRMAGDDGVLRWTPVIGHVAADGMKLFSPEPFVYNGKSYAFMSASVRPNKFRSEIWIANLDAAAPVFRRITDNTVLRTRTDPEVFVTDLGPMVYYNRLIPEEKDDGRYGVCRRVHCSEGIWRADPGLGPQWTPPPPPDPEPPREPRFPRLPRHQR